MSGVVVTVVREFEAQNTLRHKFSALFSLLVSITYRRKLISSTSDTIASVAPKLLLQ